MDGTPSGARPAVTRNVRLAVVRIVPESVRLMVVRISRGSSVSSVLMRQRGRSIQAGGFEYSPAWWAQAGFLGCHAGCNATHVGNFGRTEPESVRRAGLALLLRYFESSSARDDAQTEASDQDNATGLTGQKGDAVNAHEKPPRLAGDANSRLLFVTRCNHFERSYMSQFTDFTLSDGTFGCRIPSCHYYPDSIANARRRRDSGNRRVVWHLMVDLPGALQRALIRVPVRADRRSGRKQRRGGPWRV